MKKLFLFLFVVALTLSSLFFTEPSASLAINEDTTIKIQSNESIKPLFAIPYGEEKENIGIKERGSEGDTSNGVSSFFVKDGIFYILDNVHKKIIVYGNGVESIIPLNENTWLEDLYVDKKNNIYVLDFLNREVIQHNSNGDFVKSYKVPSTLEVPTGVTVNDKGEIIVDQAQEITANLSKQEISYTSREINTKGIILSEKKVNESRGLISINEGNKITDIQVPFEESFGGITVNSIGEKEVIYTKTEVASNIPLIMAESHVHLVTKYGYELGAVRIPLEKMYYAPRHLIRVDNNKIYLLSPEKTELVIYELTPGKNYKTTLSNRISEFIKNHPQEVDQMKKNILNFDERIDISGNTGTNGYLHRADALSRANQMINHSWTTKSGNLTTTSGSTLPSYLRNISNGTTVTGLPYKWGGSDGLDYGTTAEKRGTFSSYQSNGSPTGDVNTNHSSVSSITGVDCSGFAQLAWFRIDKKYATSTMSQITSSINKANLKYMDALNHSGYHIVLYNGEGSGGVNTKEATVDGKGAAQTYSRTWAWLETTNKFVPVRYNRIVDDGGALPLPYNN
ncbi:hypothetical protein BACCIP111883_02829 [Sutcliffiella rhizosphaerae]|uniref:Uncharacterized protein n=2 Tax=Sutcliffiella rhizosphaerae TaxID=2880967 RepID=A0ABM8YPV9_9BACI|nr:hypothetical protein BACCIP111883_02829 [Sutcliffiella rhizosphaerae]